MTLLDHVVVLIEPVAGDEAIVDLARDAALSGSQVTVLLRLGPGFRADVARFAASEDLDLDLAHDLAVERVVARFRSMFDPRSAILVVGDGTLPLEHPSLFGATALAVPASSMDDPRLRAELSGSSLPVVVAPATSARRVPAGVA